MGLALARRLVAAGHDVRVGSRDPERGCERAAKVGAAFGGSCAAAAVDAEAIILAVPWHSVPRTLDTLGDLENVILVDTTNPFVEGSATDLCELPGPSGAELIQEMARDARVVKAWNHLYAGLLRRSVDIDGSKPTIFIAGDDSEAKELVAGLVFDTGYEPADAGELSSARYLEPLAALMTTLDRNSGGDAIHALKLLRRERLGAGGRGREGDGALVAAGIEPPPAASAA